MDREGSIQRIRDRTEPWDIIVIGGGATGAGCALDAASRGFDVLLLEQHDFGKGTSSRSTKLIHGGVRYLKQGNITLVREALKERGRLLKIAPHAVKPQAFIIPCYSLWQKAVYGFGMKVYDLLAGKYSIGRSRIMSRRETLERLPSIEPKGLSGGVLYLDGQFDDTRLLIDVLQTAVSHGAFVANYAKVTGLSKGPNGRVNGVEFEDSETGEIHNVSAKVVINAAGIFCDEIARADVGERSGFLRFAQGIHIVLSRKFLSSDDALMIPQTGDGRVLFCIPWHGYLLIGTTDTPVDSAKLEPKALDAEIDFVLETTGEYLETKPTRDDILSVWAGIRPLVDSDSTAGTSSLSRGHYLYVDKFGLITIAGGKWTTYRRMAEHTVNKAADLGGLGERSCITETLRISPPEATAGERLHPEFAYTTGDVVRAVRDEMARTVEDVLARRTRILFLNAEAAVNLAPVVANEMAVELNKDDEWKEVKVREFLKTAEGYGVHGRERSIS